MIRFQMERAKGQSRMMCKLLNNSSILGDRKKVISCKLPSFSVDDLPLTEPVEDIS